MSKQCRLTVPLPRLKMAAKRHDAAIGTGRANIDKLQGSRPIRGTAGWGGARNSALRTSEFLTLSQCEGLIEAAEHAEKIGLPFNRHWTVHYESAGIEEAAASGFIRKLMKLAGDFARRHGGHMAGIWMRENGKGKGGHVHILFYLPLNLSLSGKTRRWVRLAGGHYRKGVSHIRSIAGSLQAAESGSDYYQRNLTVVRMYGLKGASQAAGESLGLKIYGIGGAVVGKRCGWTQNIGKAAREKFA